MSSLGPRQILDLCSGNYVDISMCEICSERPPFIILDKGEYYYSNVCHGCRSSIPRVYVEDKVVNNYIDSKFKKGPLCEQCKKKCCFIRIDVLGRYFTKKCTSCIGMCDI